MKDFSRRFIISTLRFSLCFSLVLTLLFVVYVIFTNNGKCQLEMYGSLWEPCTVFEEIVRFELGQIFAILALILGAVIALIVEIIRSLRKIKEIG